MLCDKLRQADELRPYFTCEHGAACIILYIIVRANI